MGLRLKPGCKTGFFTVYLAYDYRNYFDYNKRRDVPRSCSLSFLQPALIQKIPYRCRRAVAPADERFMDLLHSRRGLFIIEKIDERDVLLHRRR